jgi:hypothetical protein
MLHGVSEFVGWLAGWLAGWLDFLVGRWRYLDRNGFSLSRYTLEVNKAVLLSWHAIGYINMFYIHLSVPGTLCCISLKFYDFKIEQFSDRFFFQIMIPCWIHKSLHTFPVVLVELPLYILYVISATVFQTRYNLSFPHGSFIFPYCFLFAALRLSVR